MRAEWSRVELREGGLVEEEVLEERSDVREVLGESYIVNS